MKEFLKRHGIWVLFVTAVVAVALALLSYLSNSPLSNVANIVASPFRSAYASAAAWINDKQNYYRDTTALEEENRALRQQVAQMEDDVRQAKANSEENQRLRRLLNLREQRKDFDFEAATITEHSTSNWISSLTLNRGSSHGVAVGDSVITETGALVGLISEAGTNWSTVLTLIDTDTALGAQVSRTGDLGVAEGDFSLMGDGLLRLNYLATEARLLNGDLVVTSGLGGYYPSGLVIGAVQEERADDSGSMRNVILAPAADFDSLKEVFIIKNFDVVS